MRSKIFTAAAVMALVLPAVAQAQTATVTATAIVQATISASTTNQLNFGTLMMGASSEINSGHALASAGAAGRGQVHVQHNSNVNVSTSFPLVLTRTGGATLAFAPTCATSNTSGAAGTAVPDCTNFSFTAATPGTQQSTYILVGGTVTGNAAAGVGTFTGDVIFTLTAAN
jgi:hypothetical protein